RASMSRSRNPPARGQGAARAKQMGLLLDLNPDGGMDDGENDEDLEAELMNLVGSGCGGRAQPKKAPVAMAEIERMAALCMKDIDDDVGDEDLEDEDLLAELNEVLEDSEEETSAPTPSAFTPSAPKVTITSHSPATAPSGATGVESMLMERIQMYNTAISNAKAAGESSKVRRYERGLKTLQSMLTSVKKGKPINEEEVPPPVALGGKPSALPEVVPTVPQVPHPVDKPPSSYSQKPSKEAPPPQAVLSRQREYKLAAINAKQNGDINLAKQHYMKMDAMLEASSKPVTSAVPAAPAALAASAAPAAPTYVNPASKTSVLLMHLHFKGLPAPKTIAEALHQRMEIYKSAAEGAKSKGDDRKARMHQRIVKQYQDAIKTQKAGRPVNLSDLPMPPGKFKCMGFCQQFTEYGNIAEAFKFEKLMGECMKSIEILKNGYAKGHPVPKCRTEERTFNTVKIYSNLTPNDMVLYIIKGVNLPAPPGVSPNDLDASVKFEFPFPSEEAQQDKTNNVKGSNNPEFKEQFRLNINRSHRAFKRVIQSKGIKFEVIHKGGFFKNDRVVGTAQLKLEALENNCDFREFIEVMDGRKATGGKLEVRVKIREPVSGAHLQPITEKWLVLDPVSPLSPPERQKERVSNIL
uniref:Coiled-coil and C2 domain-containing protein 1B n=1 Tax=Periophthalmus magnuspinnatus TaxID=409849 RepID=A0A3B4ASX5_9GOBI